MGRTESPASTNERDLVLEVLRELVPDLTRGSLRRDGRSLSWVGSSPHPLTVILDAGSGATLMTWAPVLKDLADDYRVIAYERAGYGRSDPTPHLALEGQVDDLVSLIEWVGGGPLLLVGHSWGGLLVQLATWERPSAVAGLVLIDPSYEEIWADESASAPEPLIGPDSATWHSEVGELRAEIEREANELAGRIVVDRQFKDRLVAAELSYLAADDQARIWFDEFPMMIGSIGTIRRRRERATWIDAPIELLTATGGLPESFRQSKLRRVAELTECLGDVHHTAVADSGHNIHEEKPDLIVDSIRSVLHRADL